jgi:methyltransferase family protein
VTPVSKLQTPDTAAYQWRTVYWARSARSDGVPAVELDVAVVDAPERLWFLEHVYDHVARRATTELVARAGSTLYVSDDLGGTWRTVEGPPERVFSLCFTTASGRRLLQDIDSPEVHIFDRSWRYLGARTAGDHPWHGTWSVDQSPSGIVMFCEYTSHAPTLRVLRSADEGDSWVCAFAQAGHHEDPAAGRVRHFHTCQADPFLPGRWYLSSGDRRDQNSVWYSDDDGLSWRHAEPAVVKIGGSPIPETRLSNVLRHTAEVIVEDAVIWPTDDHLGSAAGLVRLAKPDLDEARVVADFGGNELRNVIALGDETLFVLSESKLDPTVAEAYCVTVDGRILASFLLENPAAVPATFARSRSSKAAVDGVFLSFSDLDFAGKPRLLRWAVRVTGGDGGETARETLLSRCERARARGSDGVSELASLQDAYRRHFQCNVCSDKLAREVMDADPAALSALHDPDRFTDARRVEYPCPHCGSRIRGRTARVLVSRFVQNRSGRLLLVSTAKPEQRWFRARYDTVTHISLEGDFGDPEVVLGVDLRRMPQIPTAQYDLMYASCVLDYIPELDQVADEAMRVLAPGGEFAFFIMPYRLVDGSSEHVVKHRNALEHEAYAKRPGGGETGIPSCEFGVEYVTEAFTAAGFAVEALPVFDPLSRTKHRWFVATKPRSWVTDQSEVGSRPGAG